MLSAPEADSLLATLCSSLGFCLPPRARTLLTENPPVDVDRFTDAVFVGEGLDPSTANRQLYRQVRAIVAEAFRLSGESSSALSALRENMEYDATKLDEVVLALLHSAPTPTTASRERGRGSTGIHWTGFTLRASFQTPRRRRRWSY
jgi:hypothetical protein